MASLSTVPCMGLPPPQLRFEVTVRCLGKRSELQERT